MEIRRYNQSDKAEVIHLIKQTIYHINKQDYLPSQIKAWAEIDSNLWDESLINQIAIVGIIEQKIVGFSDMSESGFIDRLFVHHQYQGDGIASQLVKYLEKHVTCKQYNTFASITAKIFFKQMNYKVIKENQVMLRGETFLNYYMVKDNTKI